MKKILLLITFFIALFFIACETKTDYPTSGKIELTAGKIDTLSMNIETAVKTSMRKGQEAIATFQQDSIYDLQWIQADTLPKGTVKQVRFNYSGKNIASRIVRRKAVAYLKADLTVLDYENLIYVDAMTKDSIKNSRRTID